MKKVLGQHSHFLFVFTDYISKACISNYNLQYRHRCREKEYFHTLRSRKLISIYTTTKQFGKIFSKFLKMKKYFNPEIPLLKFYPNKITTCTKIHQ